MWHTAMTKSTRRSRPAPGLCSGVCHLCWVRLSALSRGVCVLRRREVVVEEVAGAGSYQFVQMTRSTRPSAAAFFASAALAFFSSLILFLHFSATCPNFPQCEHLFSSVLCSQNLELWSFCLQCLQCTFFRHFSVL